MSVPQSAPCARKQRGGYPTPHWLVDMVVAHTVPDGVAGRPVRVLDPACGDGRFLAAAARRLLAVGAVPDLVGMDIDSESVTAARRALGELGDRVSWRVEHGDALATPWGGEQVDIVVGNPPYLSQLAAATTRGGASRHGGGPYADAAVEFLALAGRVVRQGSGRIGLVLPQSILASRDAAAVRAELDSRATMEWSWWSPRPVFDAQVLVCGLVFAARPAPSDGLAARSWSGVVTGALGVPPVPSLQVDGTFGQRARLTANFRDQYYGLVPAVREGGTGPRLVTSGLVDPGRCAWGRRDVTFAKRRFRRPTVELDRLSPAMRRWADELLVPKVLVANQTRVIEAVADPDGRWLPGVPLITARPIDGADAWALAAVLTSGVATAWAWHRAGGTGLSAHALRLGPRWLADLPWPAGELDAAVAALRTGEVQACASAVGAAYGVAPDDGGSTLGWWAERLPNGG